MAAIDVLGTSGMAAAILPVETGLAIWIVVGALVAGAVGLSLAAVPPSVLLKRLYVPRRRGASAPVTASA